MNAHGRPGPTITAVVGAYNAERYIAQTIESILAQTRPADEIVVVDDGSTDGTLRQLELFAGRIRVVTQSNGGCPAAFNRAFAEATGDYVGMCGADDLWAPAKLELQAAALAAHPEIDIAFGHTWSFDAVEAPWPDPPGDGVLDAGPLLNALYHENIVCASSVLVRRSLYQRLGPFIEEVDGERFACDDYDYWLRALTHGAVFYYGKGLHTRYRRHDGNATLNQGWLCRSRTATHRLHARAIPDARLVSATLASDLRLQARAEASEGEMSRARRSFIRSQRYEPDARAIAFALILSLPERRSRQLIGRWEHVTQRDGASRLIRNAALRAQRSRQLHDLLPPIVRQQLSSRMSAWLQRSAPGEALADWSTPLLPTHDQPVAAADLALLTTHDQPVAAPGLVLTAPVARMTPVGRMTAQRAESISLRSDRHDQPTRCLIATSDLDVGGMDEMVAFLARRLRSDRLETAVLHACRAVEDEGAKGRLARMLSDAGIEVQVLAQDAGRHWMQAWQPDVISAHGAPDWVLDESRLMSVPYVEVLHGMHSLFSVDWRAEAKRSRDLAAIVAVSEHVRRWYLDRVAGFPVERIITIPNGVDDVRRAPVDRARARSALGLRDEFLFVSLARHCLQKNTYGLVSAFESVAAEHPDSHLVIAGRAEDPLYTSQVLELRDSLRAGDRIHLRDHVPNPALVLSAADGFVLDSFFEGWALASMEALHAGVPVVASDVGGAREQLGENGDRGHLVANPLGNPLDVSWESMRAACYAPQVNRDELVAAMSELVRNRRSWAARRTELASDSRERFHPDRCLAAHAELLHSIARSAALHREAPALSVSSSDNRVYSL